MVIIKEKDFLKIRNSIKKLKNEKIIFCSKDDELNRKVIEKLEINVLLICQKEREDFQKQRNSGFNQVLAKVCSKKKIKVGINLDEIIESEQKEKALIIGRIIQNIKLCNKNKISMEFIWEKKENERNKYDLKSLGTILGMPSWMVKYL
jgi:RNase P/RNase MRP subunit p30